jgi:hypothetical protein
MWIQGIELINKWRISPEELLQSYQDNFLVPYKRITGKPMGLDELFLSNPQDPHTLSINQKNEQTILIESLQMAYYKKEEILEFLKSTGIITEAFSFPEVESRVKAESLKALLLKSEKKTWREISQELWPKEKYENGNSVHKRIERRLKSATDLLEQVIEPFHL